MMVTVPHVTSGSGLRKFQAEGFLLDRVYSHVKFPFHIKLVNNDDNRKSKFPLPYFSWTKR